MDIEGGLEAQQEIEAVYSSWALPTPLDIIIEANLRACGLAALGDEGAIYEV